MTIGILILGIIFICLISLLSFLLFKEKQKTFVLINSNSNVNTINNFEKYIVALEFFLEKSYSIIYKDRILVYSLEGYSPNENDFQIATQDFITLSLKLMGRRFQNEFNNFFGDTETLFFYMTEYFNSKTEMDEIKQSTINNLGDSETNSE